MISTNGKNKVQDTVLVSYNCKSIKRSVDEVRSLCKIADIIAIQETWLLPSDLAYLTSIDEDFGSTGTSAVDTAKGMLMGRPHGGVALLWRKSVFSCVSIVPCVNPRIAAIKVSMCDKTVLIMTVYMPVNCIDNLTEFTDCLGQLNAITEDSGIENVIVLGDFNSHPNELFFKELASFCEEQKWICADVKKLSIDSETFTFISDAHGCKRWLDHSIVTQSAWALVTKVYVKHDVYSSDHFPLFIHCRFNVSQRKVAYRPPETDSVSWGVRSPEQIKQYCNLLNTGVRSVSPAGVNMCGPLTVRLRRSLSCGGGTGVHHQVSYLRKWLRRRRFLKLADLSCLVYQKSTNT
ncbi:uncharacterized protein, partial [Choristoneura fumiferana]|uniref:uncharacterized protein n=1 Tax=Choristoneura fumiferana TaxID=7141 RepID=UPI003D1559A4